MTTGDEVQVHRLYIKATPQAIWEAITQAERTRLYFYGSLAEYDLRPGGTYRSRGLAGQGTQVMTDGEVIELEPPRRLVQTWRACWLDEPFTRLTWEIDALDSSVCTLTVTHDVSGAPRTAEQVSGRDAEAGGGWSYVLSGLKTLLETGSPMEG